MFSSLDFLSVLIRINIKEIINIYGLSEINVSFMVFNT